MNREIKFKVWDIYKKVFIPNDVFAITTSNYSYFAVMIKDWENYKEGEYMYPNAQTLVQFTSLLDKNGKEIYEGDIVKWGHIKGGEENPIRVAEVKIQPDIQFHIINPKKKFLWYNKVFHYGNFIYKDTENWLEIIGNIFEHAHLLTSNH